MAVAATAPNPAAPVTLPKADDIIDIALDGIGLGFDGDGLPKTVAGDGVITETPKPNPELETLKRERDEARAERERLVAEHADAQAKLKTESAARIAAEEASGKSTDIAMRAHWAKVNADAEQLNGHITATQSQIAGLEKELHAAAEASDPARQAQATRQLARLEAYLVRLEEGKQGAESEIARVRDAYTAAPREKPKPAETKTEEAKPPPGPIQPKSADEFISWAPTATRSWLRDHKEFATPGSREQKRMNLFAAEWMLENGEDPKKLDTSEFADALNHKFFPTQSEPEHQEISMAEEPAPKPTVTPAQRARVAAAAPVSRSGDVFSSRNPNAAKVKLPPKVAEFVRVSGLDPTKYAAEVVAQIKSGKLPKDWLDPDFPHDFG